MANFILIFDRRSYIIKTGVRVAIFMYKKSHLIQLGKSSPAFKAVEELPENITAVVGGEKSVSPTDMRQTNYFQYVRLCENTD